MPNDIEDSVPEPIQLRRFDMHSLWRVLLWGASASMALAVVAGAAFSDLGTDRLKQTLASIIEPARTALQPDLKAQQIAELEKQTNQLAQTVRDLTAERDRVRDRVAVLEHSLDDITGSIKRQSAQLAAQKTVLESAKVAPPVVAAPASVSATSSPPASTAPAAPAPTATASTPMKEPATASTLPAPIPPSRVANAAPTAKAEPTIDPTIPTMKELGVDLGGATTLDGLRAHWAALKANVGPELVGLQPSFTTRRKLSGTIDYRLVLGPMPNGATALRLCAKLAASRVACRAGTFTVQQLAER